jgi:hypothetical protein
MGYSIARVGLNLFVRLADDERRLEAGLRLRETRKQKAKKRPPINNPIDAPELTTSQGSLEGGIQLASQGSLPNQPTPEDVSTRLLCGTLASSQCRHA